MAAATHRSCSGAVQAAQATSTGSIQAVEAGLASALPQVVSYRQNLITARRGAALATAGAARREWLHSRERPCPLLTQLERPPLASRLVPALRAPSGGLVTGRCIPAVVGAYWASVSSPPPPTRSANLAQEDVLATHRQAPRPLPPTVADSVGSLSVAMFECRKALKQSPPGKSPGPDGIPVELYRTYADIFTPLLCRLFTAIGTRETLPHNFLEGLLIILRKGGDHLNPGNYRPITLLNSDYKLLDKCLETAGLGGGFLTWILPIGVPVIGPLPDQVLGVPVVESATTLGITFANGHQTTCPPMTTQWVDKLDHVQQCYSRPAKLPLSMFGRGLSSSAYGISKLLYHAEFEGIPLDMVEQLSCLTTKLVDRGLAPESTALKLPGVSSALLPGSPKLGGDTNPLPNLQPVAKASPMVLHRMALGIAALSTAAGPIAGCLTSPTRTGSWCLASPLWGFPVTLTKLKVKHGTALQSVATKGLHSEARALYSTHRSDGEDQ
eukprot:gene18036-biopygen26988